VTYFVPITTVAGYIAAIYLSYFLGRLLITYLCGPIYLGHLSQNSEGLAAVIGWSVALLPGMFWGTVAGSKFGSEFGELMFGPNGIVVGLAAGIVLVTVAVTSIGALAGSLAGKLLKPSAGSRSSD
jgi:hypothetical protein